MAKCSIPGCNSKVKYKESGLCSACYHGMYYWKGKTPTRIVNRIKQLARLQARMDIMMPTVRALGRRRRRA